MLLWPCRSGRQPAVDDVGDPHGLCIIEPNAIQSYMLSAEGFLMPTKKNQPPPDLRYFKKRGQ